MNTQQELHIPAIPAATLAVTGDLLNIAPLMKYAEKDVKTEGDQEVVLGYIVEIKGRTTAIEAEFERRWGNEKRALKSLLAMIKGYEDGVRDRYLKPIEAVAALLNQRVVKFWKDREVRLEREAREARDRRLFEEKEKLETATTIAAATGDEDAMAEMQQRAKNITALEEKPIEVSQTIRTNAGTLAQVKTWKWRISDESKIPAQYWVLDEKSLNQIARAYANGPTVIPGIDFYQETRTSLRA